MSAHTHGGARAGVEIPSMLDLVHLSRRPMFPPGGIELYRQIALFTDMKEGDEVLVVPSGLAVTLEYFVSTYEVVGSGVEDDPVLLDNAEARLRKNGTLDRVNVQPGAMDQLPYRDGIFDVVIAELGLTSQVSPESAVSEIVRVAKPGGSVVLVQPVWKTAIDSVRREVLSQHLGCHPLMVVEWKRLLMGAGLEALRTQDWSDEATSFRPQVRNPFPDFTELFTVPEKLGILRRAARRWGWIGVWGALARAREVHKLLAKRILGLDVVMGVKRAASQPATKATGANASPGVEESVEKPLEASQDEVSVEASIEAPAEARAEAPVEAPAEAPVEDRAPIEEQVSGLPLFGDGSEPPR
jgi:SAM-dependent methyltransferase